MGDIVFLRRQSRAPIRIAFSVTICDAIQHYIDGSFFFTLCVLLSMTMAYKYWDSIAVRFFLMVTLFNDLDFASMNIRNISHSLSDPRL
jgi:hypothetical protein